MSTVETTFLDPAAGFSQAAVVDANGVRTVYVSGQTSVAEGYAAQAREAAQSVVDRLAKAGAKPADIVKLNTYIVGYEPSKMEEIGPALAPLYAGGQLPAHTLVGVAALFAPEMLIEIEAVAVLPIPPE